MDTRGKTYKYEIEEKDGGIYKGTKDEAIEEFKKEMFIKYNRIDPSPEIEYIVKEIIINSILQIENNMTPIEDTPMRQATQLDYNIIDEYKDFLQNNGTCVIDNFIGMYGEALKITRDNFKCLVKEYYKQYDINWTVEDGISPKCVSSICQKFDIAHYAFDVKKNCFIKNISRNSNYKALVYFAVNNHMYLILDSAVRKSLIERTKVKESFNTSLLEHEEAKEENNIFNNYKIVVNPTQDNLFQQSENTIYMYSRPGKTNINDIFTILTVNKGVPQNVKCKKTKIIGFTYEIKKINYVFVCDPNDVHQITFKEIQVLCEKNNVPFKNQTFTQLIKQIRTKYFDELKGRIKFSKEFKQLVLDKSKNKCACCNCKLDKFHIDHIIPLANDGTNELSNLQALCIGCHMDKTANEQDNGQYVKFTDTESSFNEKVQEIMNSVLSSSYAFVEQLEKTHMDEKIFTVDINKCRRNIY